MRRPSLAIAQILLKSAHRFHLAVALFLSIIAGASSARGAARLLLHLPFDGVIAPAVGHGETVFSGKTKPEFIPGRFGSALRIGAGETLSLPELGNLDKQAGTLSLWVRPAGDGNDGRNHIFFQDDLPFSPPGSGCFRLWQWSVGLLRFDTRNPEDQYLTTRRSAAWRAGQWRHIAVTWNARTGTRLFVDGVAATARNYSFRPKSGKRLIFGGDADVDDIRVYNRPLDGGQIERVMQGLDIEPVEILGVDAPARITPGVPFDISLSARLSKGLHGPYAFVVRSSGMEAVRVALREYPPSPAPVKLGPFQVVVPEYVYPSPGPLELQVHISGAFEAKPENGTCRVTVISPPTSEPPRWSLGPDGVPFRNGKPWTAGLGPEGGLLYRGTFLTGAPGDRDRVVALVRSGEIVDALRCRLVDAVDCSKTDHGFAESAPTRVAELVPGKRFRLTGKLEEVTRTRKRGGRNFKVLPGFSYRLRSAPRPTPHVVVVESVNDRERYLEVAINTASGSRPDPCLASVGTGASDLMNLYAAYNGREYATDGQPYRLSFLVFPKTDALEIMITCSRNSFGLKSSAPGAASSIRVYEVLDPLDATPNPVVEPQTGPRREIGLFDPEVRGMFERYGFPNTGAGTRAATLRRFIEYNRYLGFNRFEFRPFQLSEKAYFKTPRFAQASDLDMFTEFLPLARAARMTVVPRVMYLHSYHCLFEKDKENILQARTGEELRFGREGPIPDVLRPQVQKIVEDSLRAMLEVTADWRDVVPAVCFDTSIGGVYAWRKGPASDVGYSAWDVAEFCRDTGRTLPAGITDHAGRYAWLKEHCWTAWLDWRAGRWFGFIGRLRTLVRADRRKFILNPRIMPRDEWNTDHVPLKDIYRYSLFDPDRFSRTPEIHRCGFIRVGADRYFGKLWWKPWFYAPEQPALIRPDAMEIYYNYWELPRHPWGFRVGPGSPLGRTFFEPYTYAMRTVNPRTLLVFCWFRGSYGHETDLREWTRAYRALPAVPPRDFAGRVTEVPAADERLWIKWFGTRLCVLNDAPRPRTVTLEFPTPATFHGQVLDAALARKLRVESSNGRLRFTVNTRAFDLRTFVFDAEP